MARLKVWRKRLQTLKTTTSMRVVSIITQQAVGWGSCAIGERYGFNATKSMNSPRREEDLGIKFVIAVGKISDAKETHQPVDIQPALRILEKIEALPKVSK